MRTAELIRGPYTGYTSRCLWATSDGFHIVTSSADNSWAFETMAFPADENGEITDFGELSCVGHGQHREAIEAAGYTIKENK